MNHLNIFRFFNESESNIFIEKNLSRAFALCLTNNSFCLNEYIRSIVTESDYQYLFSTINEDSECKVDIEVETSSIDVENYKTVYAIAMTSDRSLDMSNFSNLSKSATLKKNYTDIFISIKDIAILIEVKKTEEDCKQQLFNQILPFYDQKEKITIIPKRFSWQEVVAILEKIKHVMHFNFDSSVFIDHFLELSGIRHPEWFDPKPFDVLPFSPQLRPTNYIQLEKRMRQALAGVSSIAGDNYEVLRYNDRLGIKLPFEWATELIPEFEIHSDNTKEYVTFYAWPGNTKKQGHTIFRKPLNWVKKTKLQIDGESYDMEIVYNIKLSHFMGKFVSGINFHDTDLNKPLYTLENFHNSGKWARESWNEFEQFLDEHFKPEFNWREKCHWEQKFLNMGKTYLFMSLGFEVAVYIPFHKFQSLDKEETDVENVSTFIDKIAKAFQTLI